MESKLCLFLVSMLVICVAENSSAQERTGQIPGQENEVSVMLGYSPANIGGSRIGQDRRIAFSFRAPRKAFNIDFEAEYFSSHNFWLRAVLPQDTEADPCLCSENTQNTLGFGISAGISKIISQNASIGIGINGNYLNIKRNLNNFIFGLEPEETLNPSKEHGRFFSPGMFLQTDLGIPLKGTAQLYLRQKLNVMYIGDNFNSSLWKSWVSFTFYGGLKFFI